MFATRKAQKILKQYGKVAYRERIQYIDSMTNSRQTYFGHISWRHMAKRCFIIVVILLLSFALLVIGANALCIKLFHFSFFDKTDHVEIVSNETNKKTEQRIKKFYAVEYVPDGYNIVAEDSFADITLNRVYKNTDEEYLYIEQEIAEGYRANLDNENCTISTKTIREMETYIYDYGKQKVYLLQQNDIVIKISGYLTEKEFENIIYGLKFQ